MSALTLKILACVLMLTDHIGYLTKNMYLRIPGRLAFPIFAFMIANGYRHTHCKWRYGLRLALCAVLSEPAFDYFCYGKWYDTRGTNVLVTLLAGFLCLWAFDLLRSARLTCLYPVVLAAACAAVILWKTDYSYNGVLTVAAFGVRKKDESADEKSLSAMACLLFAAVTLWKPMSYVLSVLVFRLTGICLYELPVLCEVFSSGITDWDWISLFRVAAVGLLLLYHGEKGSLPVLHGATWLKKAGQLTFYLFYPAHMLLLSAFFR